jgi:mutator protein MutT
MSEFVDVYNSKKEKTGKIVERKRGSSLEKGEYIISVTCWIINKDGKILLTQRKQDKHNGGKWEPTTGLVVSGESSLQGIQRELREEIGIETNESEIRLVREKIEERDDVNFFRDIYLLAKDIELDTISYNDGEVVNAKYVTIDEFNEMIANGEILEKLKYFTDLYKECNYENS